MNISTVAERTLDPESMENAVIGIATPACIRWATREVGPCALSSLSATRPGSCSSDPPNERLCVGLRMYHPELIRHPESCPALVLNADYTPLSYYPLSLWPWQTAIKAMFLERVDASHYDREVHSPSVALKLPSVIALRDYVRPNEYPAFTRFNLFLRDKFHCVYCGSHRELTFDHVVPRAQGGRTMWENVATACAPCNLRKGGRTPVEAHMHLMREPIRPTTWQLQEHGRSVSTQLPARELARLSLLGRRVGALSSVKELAYSWPDVGALERDREVGDHKTNGASAVVALALEAVAVERLLADQLRNRVGELDFTARALLLSIENAHDLRLEDVAAGERQFEGAVPGAGFSTMLRISIRRPSAVPGSITPYLWVSLVGDLERGDDVAAGSFIGLDHLGEAIWIAHHQLIRKQHRERLIADDGRAHQTACPRPSGCCWRTVMIAEPAFDGSRMSRLLPLALASPRARRPGRNNDRARTCRDR